MTRHSARGLVGVRSTAAAVADAGATARFPFAPTAVASVWRSTISAAFRSGTLPAGETEPDANDALQKQSGFLKRVLDIAAGEILVKAGLLRQYLRHCLLQRRRQAVRCQRRSEIGKQRRQAALLRGGVSRRHGNRDALQRGQRIVGRRARWRMGSLLSIDRRVCAAAAFGIAPAATPRPARPPRAGCRLPSATPQAAGSVPASAQSREHVDREAGDRDLHQIVERP